MQRLRAIWKGVIRIKKKDLLSQFESAKHDQSDFVYVAIIAEGTKEVILIPRESFVDKQSFYERSYTDDLIHVMNKNVKIVDCGSLKTDVFDSIFKGGEGE